MNFDLTDDQLAIRARARAFAEEQLAPVAAEYDQREEFPREQFRRAAEQGFFGLSVPRQYGGLEADTVSYALVLEELSRGMAAFGVPVSVHNSLVCSSLARLGTPEQRERFLPRLATGGLLGGFSLTEPDSGSDASAMRTTARKADGGWVLSGHKTFVSMGASGSLFVVMAVTDPDAKRSHAISAFLVERGMPGFSTGEKVSKMGMRATDTAELLFDEVYVPDANLLGDPGDGFKVALSSLDGGRIGIAAQALGIAQAALDSAASYALDRKQFGEAIINFQAVQFKLSDMATEIEAARLLTLEAAALKDAGEEITTQAAMAKLIASQTAVRATDMAVQIYGGYGYLKGNAAERLYRDAKVTEIYEGTSEVQRIVIAEKLIAEPATYPLPSFDVPVPAPS
jgi:alkylation response protein AidB-like acyl-CoA dehydrogenase